MEAYNILIIDDDPNILKLLGDLLSSHPDYRLFQAKDGIEAMEHLSCEPMDVVLTDIHMPGFTGLELMADIQKIKIKPEILVMTANGTEENVEMARKIGARSLILKPFDNLDVVEGEIEKAIQAASARRATSPEPTAGAAQAEAVEEPAGLHEEEKTPGFSEPPDQDPDPETVEAGTKTVAIPVPSELKEPRSVPNENGDRAIPVPSLPLTSEISEPSTGSAAKETPPAEETPAAAAISVPEEERVQETGPSLTPSPRSTPVIPIIDSRPAGGGEKLETVTTMPPSLRAVVQVIGTPHLEKMRIQVPLIALHTCEEKAVVDAFWHLAAVWGRDFFTWSAARGIVDRNGKPKRKAYRDPVRALEFLRSVRQPCIGVLLDFQPFLENPVVTRMLKEMVQGVETVQRCLVISAPELDLPPALRTHCVVFNWPPPARMDQFVIQKIKGNLEAALGRLIHLDEVTLGEILSQVKEMPTHQAQFQVVRALVATLREPS